MASNKRPNSAEAAGSQPKKPRLDRARAVLVLTGFSTDDVSEPQIRALFESDGPVDQIVVTPGSGTTGIARVVMSEHKHTYPAVQTLDGMSKWNTTIHVRIAKQESDYEIADRDVVYGPRPMAGLVAPPVAGQVAVAPVDGQVGIAPVDGLVATAPLDGQVATAPLDGQVAVAPVDGQVATAPLDGQVAVAPVDGQLAAAPVDGQVAAAPATPVDE